MHRAGLSPVLRQAPLGPHLAWVAVDRIVSASFVVNEGKVIELWLSEQRFLAKQVEPLPTLPLGAEVLSEQVDGAGRRMLVIALSSELSTSDALRDAVFAALDIVPAETAAPSEARANPSARRLTHPGSGRSVANAGRIRWGRQAGFYEVTALGRAHSALTLYAGGAGNAAK